MNKDTEVILAMLKLSRALRRCPPPPPPAGGIPGQEGGNHPEHHRPMPFPPALGRMLSCVAENPGVSSRDLCEYLDVRPSSLSEILTRAENDGWITRTASEEDRRIQRVNLSDKGKSFIAAMREAEKKDAARKTSCLTDEEKAQFCALCNRLSEHMESLDFPEFSPRPGIPDEPDFDRRPSRNPRRPFMPEGGRIRC